MISAQTFLVPVLVVMLVVVFFAVVRILARSYIKVAPNEVLVIYGRKYKYVDADGKTATRGFRLVTGGAALRIPLLENSRMLPLDAFQVKFAVQNVPSKEGVRVTVNSVATLKIGSEETMLGDAVRRFLDRDLKEIQEFAREVMEGGLRGVVATMTVEQLVQERTQFGAAVQEQVTGDLQRLGILLDNFLIQDVSDNVGYIDALGQKQTAEVKRDASIGEAEAKRDEDIRVAEAQRQADEKSSDAKRAGETAKAQAEQAISNASRERDTIKAQNDAKIAAEQAKILIAAEIAKAEKDKELRVAHVAAEEAEVQSRTLLQEKERERKDAELRATIIVQANRNKEAQIVTAEGVRESTIIKAEGDRRAAELLAEAERIKREQLAQGEMITAERDADGRKARASARQTELEAEARGTQATMEAEAKGIKAKLEAEAEGVRKKAEAYRALDQAGKLLLILEHLPEVLRAGGDAIHQAGLGTVAPMAEAIGTGLSGIEEVRIIDLGGSSGSADGQPGADALSRFMGNIPKTTFDLLQQVRALGLEKVAGEIADKLGVDLSSILGEEAAHVDDEQPPEARLTPVKKKASPDEANKTTDK
ncbi:MAG: SPFH domain-containing protein [bacterium]